MRKYPAQEMYDGDGGGSIQWPPQAQRPWEVWYAWFPVCIEEVESLLHDEIVVRYKRAWLCNVARRATIGWKDGHTGTPAWEYAPAHKAVTQ